MPGIVEHHNAIAVRLEGTQDFTQRRAGEQYQRAQSMNRFQDRLNPLGLFGQIAEVASLVAPVIRERRWDDWASEVCRHHRAQT